MSKLVPKLRFKEFTGEWEEKQVGKLFKTYSGGTPSSTNKKYYGGNIPFIRSAEINKSKTELFLTNEGIKNSSAKLVKKGNVLYALYGANSGDVAISKIDGAINQAILCLDSKKDSNLFLYYNLANLKTKIINKYIQGGQGNLSGDIIKSLEIFFPSPNEQQKIANTLSSLDSLIEAYQRKVEALQKHKKGLMQQLFPSDGENVPKLRFKEFLTESAKHKSGEWEKKKLGDTGDILTGTTPSTKKDEYYKNGIYPWVTPTDITEKKDISYTSKLLTEKGLNAGRFVPKNSLLVTCIASIGKNAILRKDGSCNQQINSITPYNNFDVDFLYYLIEENIYILKENAGQGGMAMLNKSDFSNLNFYFPHKKEQQKIANTLSSLDSLIEAYQRKVEALQKHKKGLMQQMFVSGEG